MTKRQKRLLFYCAVLFFLFGSYVAIMYAQGYKYDFAENNFFKTGTFHLKVNEDAEVFVDGEYMGTTSFLGTSFSHERLLPGTYQTKVQKNDYSTWQKNIQVEEGLVTEFTSIMLLPQAGVEKDKLLEEISLILDGPSPSPTPSGSKASQPKGSPSPSPIKTPELPSLPFVIQNRILYQAKTDDDQITLVPVADEATGFKISPDKNKIAWWNKGELWLYWVNKTNYQPIHIKGDIELIKTFDAPISKLDWFRDSEHIVVESIGFKVIEIDSRGGLNIIPI